MSKRLKYTKDILTHMLTNSGGNGDDSQLGKFKSSTKGSTHRFSSTTGFQRSGAGSSNNVGKFSASTKFRTLSRGPSSEKKLFKTNFFAR